MFVALKDSKVRGVSREQDVGRYLWASSALLSRSDDDARLAGAAYTGPFVAT